MTWEITGYPDSYLGSLCNFFNDPALASDGFLPPILTIVCRDKENLRNLVEALFLRDF